ncbi:YcjF family protein [Latilactobacillus curvatus]|uniref:YcjF family protein n=1 Tax=Latilactobacillus curvatus TaxID=28038 RepID=UPI00345F0C7C
MKKPFNKQQVNGEPNPEFDSFFAEVLKKLPQQSAAVIAKSFNQSKALAEKTMAKSRTQFDGVFEDFLVGVDDQMRKKAHNIIHAASLTAAIIGCSPIPFSDAFLLVPVQLTMMARLHKLFGQSGSASLGKSLSKELVLVGLGRSAVGNILKLVPVVGTVTGSAVNATVAMSITEALGWLTVKMLNDGEDIFNDVVSFKNQFRTLFGLLRRQ